MKKSILKLSELLPDNVSEETLNKIVSVIHDTISEEITERMSVLQAKTAAFLRANIDKIKQTAISELNEENEVYQDAMAFRQLKEVMGVSKVNISESTEPDHTLSELQEENSVLLEQLNVLAQELASTKKKAKAYKAKAQLVESLTEEYEEQIALLKENNNSPVLNDKGVIIVESAKEESSSDVPNDFLTEEILALMPKN
jgi:hypothetical protein